jgi:hypothetical protein
MEWKGTSMHKCSFVPLAIAILFAIAAGAAPAVAQTWISPTGDAGTNNCTFDKPCLSFGVAYPKTPAGGWISCKEPGDYGPLTIAKSLTIDCGDNQAVLNQSLLTIATAATDVVVLKGFRVEGNNGTYTASGPTTSAGIVQFTGAGRLRLEDVTIQNFGGNGFNGLYFHPSGTSKLEIVDSHFSNIGTAGLAAGISIAPAAGATVTVAINRTVIDGNYFGIIADGSGGTIRGTVSSSFVNNNTHNGITVANGAVVLAVSNTVVSGNNFGLVASSSAAAGMLVDRSNIQVNTTGVFASGGGALYTYGNNQVNGNSTDGAFTGSIPTK